MNGLFGQQDGSVMYPTDTYQRRAPSNMPQGQPTQIPNMPTISPLENPNNALKYSVGDPIVDKYINMFLGE